jgi:Fe-S cluster biogenesis protein NfuA
MVEYLGERESEKTLVPYDDVAARVDELVRFFETHPDPAVQESAIELLQLVDALHRSPLERLAALLESYAWDSGSGISIPPLERARSDHLIRRLLQLYDLVPPDPEEADPEAEVEAALEQVRPYIQSHGGDVRAVDITDGIVTVELSGHCRGCTASQATLRGVVEETLRAYVTGFERVEIVQPAEPVASHPPPSSPVIGLDQLRATLKT